MIKILYVMASLDNGGVGKLIYDYSIRFSDNVVCDFVVTNSEKGAYEDELIQKGYKIYHIAKFRESLFKHNLQMKNIIKNGKYDIVHDNCDFRSFWTMKYAKKYKTPVRIIHLHSAYLADSKFKISIAKFFLKKSIKKSTNIFSCGKKVFDVLLNNSLDYYILPNAVEIKKYFYSDDYRNDYRKEFNINKDTFVIGNVSRFTYAKNHMFMVDLANSISKKIQNFKMVLIGNGELFENVKKYAVEKNVIDKILFLGKRSDVNRILSMLDLFILPSLFEGLPVSIIEAQANGLPAIMSKNVTSEAIFTDNVIRLPIENGIEIWENEILKMYLKRYLVPKKLYEYDIDFAASKLENYYNKLVKYNEK